MDFLKTLLAAGLAAAIAGPAVAQERISIGTGGTGGLFYVIGAGMADLLNQHMEGTTARAEVTGASVENIRRVAAGQMTFGFSRDDVEALIRHADVAMYQSKGRGRAASTVYAGGSTPLALS
jgi:TRAP-type uncharacterized transport system substrate-binding protein